MVSKRSYHGCFSLTGRFWSGIDPSGRLLTVSPGVWRLVGMLSCLQLSIILGAVRLSHSSMKTSWGQPSVCSRGRSRLQARGHALARFPEAGGRREVGTLNTPRAGRWSAVLMLVSALIGACGEPTPAAGPSSVEATATQPPIPSRTAFAPTATQVATPLPVIARPSPVSCQQE